MNHFFIAHTKHVTRVGFTTGHSSASVMKLAWRMI